MSENKEKPYCWEYLDTLWRTKDALYDWLVEEELSDECVKPLYLHPKAWQGLSEDEVMELVKECKAPYHSHALEPRLFAKAIEEKLKEKNK